MKDSVAVVLFTITCLQYFYSSLFLHTKHYNMAKAQENKLELAGILLFFILSAALFTRDIRSFQRDILPSYMETDMANMLGMDISVFLFIERAILFVTPLIIALRRKADDDQPQQEFDVPVELLM